MNESDEAYHHSSRAASPGRQDQLKTAKGSTTPGFFYFGLIPDQFRADPSHAVLYASDGGWRYRSTMVD
jgi:hypothetical protein